MSGPRILTGRASKAITRQLRRHGYQLVVPPESFQVSRTNELLPGEQAHARIWGKRIAGAVGAA
jgi:hypothetical protein